MEARDGARRVTQRHLEVSKEPGGNSSAPPVAPAPEPEPAATPLPPISREPSARELRERQDRWLQERARFEAAQRKKRSAGEASK